MNASPSPRFLDHAVLPVADLAIARERLTKLGFNVAPDAKHPFGTANCCVYFEDGTYLEPLAVADHATADAATRAGNTFTALDAAYRRNVGDNGFSAMALHTTDAEGDHAAFVEHGFSAGPMLEFSRPFIDASGTAHTASFRLAFAAEGQGKDALFFTCQRINAKSPSKELRSHKNNVTRISRVLLSAQEPQAHIELLSTVLRQPKPIFVEGGVKFQAYWAVVDVLTPARLREAFGLENAAESLSLVGLVFGSILPPHFLRLFLQFEEIPSEMRDGLLIVQPAPGQGAMFAFEETE